MNGPPRAARRQRVSFVIVAVVAGAFLLASPWARDRASELSTLGVGTHGDGPTNQAKGDSGPAVWLPPDPAAACGYVQRYI